MHYSQNKSLSLGQEWSVLRALSRAQFIHQFNFVKRLLIKLECLMYLQTASTGLNRGALVMEHITVLSEYNNHQHLSL